MAATGAMHCSAFPGCTMGTGESSGGGTGAGEGHRISQMAAKQCCLGISQCLRENGLEIQKWGSWCWVQSLRPLFSCLGVE